MAEVSAQTWDLAGREVSATLAEARVALETFGEQPDNAAAINRCAEELQRVQGVLRVLEIYGASLLAEEMALVAQYVSGTLDERKNHPEALDALLRSMVQLPSYLERVMAGGRDLALVLLPLLNDLRAVRGSPLLSEGTLLLLNLRSDQRPAPQPPRSGEPTLSAPQWARRMRTQYQSGLIGWIRDEGATEHLAVLAAVAEQIERVATEQSVYQLWWVVGAVIEALREHGLEGGVSVKRLLGLADREIRRLYEQGEARYSQSPPVELLNNLLYYIARSTSDGPRVASVRKSFRLGELLPVDPSIEAERETLSAPSIKLMQTVAAAIREDLGKVKDVLDIYVRRGGGPPAELAPQLEMLRKIGDTLGVLGLGDLRASIQSELVNLEAVVSGQKSASDGLLVQVATTLIGVEDRLDGRLVSMLVPVRSRAPGAAAARAGEDGAEPSAEFVQVQAAVLRECAVNLARIKEAIAQSAGGTLDSGGLDSWPDFMRGIKAGMLMLGKGRAVTVVDGITTLLKRVMRTGGPNVPVQFLDRLADSIVSLEYYMETLQAGRSEPGYMLDNAQACIDALLNEPNAGVPTVRPAPLGDLGLSHQATVPALTSPDHGSTAVTQVLYDGKPPSTLPSLQSHNASAWAADDAANADHTMDISYPPLLRQPAPAAEPVDPELLEIFIEEAREEVAKIAGRFPLWERSSGDEAALLAMRRSFHTLKGSGRMVGARVLADLAWAIENLLNRLLDGTLERSAAIVSAVRESVEQIPQLVEQLAAGEPALAAIDGLIGRAHALASGSRNSDPLLAAAVAAEPADATAPAAAVMAPEPVLIDDDPSLRDIYRRETDAHVTTIRAFIADERKRLAPHILGDEVYRACHTLSGSSRMAEVRHGTRLAEPLDRWLRKAHGSGVGLTDDDLSLLDECMSAMQQVAAHLDENTVFFAPHDVLRARLAGSEHDLDQRIAEAAAGSGEMIEMVALPVDLELIEPPQLTIDTADALTPATVVAPPEEPIAAAAVATPTDSVPPADADDLDGDFDPDIALIFTEEATELLDAAEGALQDWNSARSDPLRLAALKRPLHTLKGGARMAGIRSMGDLSHELETLIGQIELGIVEPDERTCGVLQSSVDELARMRESVVSNRPLRAARVLIARIHALTVPDRAIPEPAQFATAPSEPESPAGLLSTAQALEALERSLPSAEAGVPDLTATDDAATQTAPEQHPEKILVAAPAAFEPPPTYLREFVERAAAPRDESIAVPPGREPVTGVDRTEMARVDAELLDTLLNNAGEVSIGRARLEQQIGSIDHNLGELSRTVTRLKEQLRKLEIETERQILHRHETESAHRGEFDPLELDRYSSIQQFSRALAETANDVGSIQQLLETLTQDTQNLLQQQARVVTELQNGLMRTRMVPFQRHVQRLARIVRQAAADTGKRAELVVEGASGELDRQVLERMLPPFEHMLRNAVVHGIEMPDERIARGKDESGRIVLTLQREGAEVVVVVSDDGAGMNLRAIREKAQALGMLRPGQQLSDIETLQLVLEPGFSTANSVTQHAGRGVGMDVVATEIKKLGGGLHMESESGRGSRFTIRLPFTLAISHALVVRAADEYYALPLPTVEGVVRLSRDEAESHLSRDEPTFEYAGQRYRFQPLGGFVGLEPAPLPSGDVTVPVVLVRAGDHSTGIVCEELVGSREIVVKSVGPQVSAIRGISGATILGDGRIVIILDIAALVRTDWRARTVPMLARDKVDARPVALVVDDSITVRRVTQRLLERNGMRVLTARDGLDAVAVLAENLPDVILLDIEMPRMDGYEFAGHVRGDARTADIPIIMITSRVGEKHRARAIELGVDDYLGKPYQEAQLLEAIEPLVSRRREQLAALAHEQSENVEYGG